ncbi:MAG: SPFH domain-containing protein [Acholeplasmataceae bacterium]
MGILDVCKFEGFEDRRWLIYKHPNHEFNTKSKLIVGPGQVGIIVHGGKIMHIVESGTYILDSENFPFIKTFIKDAHNGQVPFTLEVYYVNKTMKLDMLWGTNDPIQLLDPKFQVKINVRARGQYALRISNYQFLISQLVGSLGGATVVDFDIINQFFRSIINTKIKSLIAQYFIKNQINILDISVYLDEISKASFEILSPEFERFGLEIVNFYYESINIPDEDLAIINDILNRNAEFNILGDNRYRTSRGFDVLDSAAKNEGAAGGMAAVGVGLGVGLGVGKQAANLTSDLVSEKPKKTVECVNCHQMIEETAKFCPICGAAQIIRCKNCNAELSSNAKFCPECGQSVKRDK